MDQWISNDVISVCQTTNIPKERVMTMRWVHTWKMAEDIRETKQKPRLLVKSFTDPELTEIRSESRTLSRLSKPLILQISASRGFRLRKNDVKTVFCLVTVKMQDEMCMQSLHKSCVTDCRSRENKCWSWTLLCSAPSKRTESLVEASCSWTWQKLDGFSTHWINAPTMFMKSMELVGLIGVYVVNLLVAGYDDDPILSAAMLKLKQIIPLGNMEWRQLHIDKHWNWDTSWRRLSSATTEICGSTGIDVCEPTPFSSRQWQINARWVNSASTSVWFCELVGKPDSSWSLCEYVFSKMHDTCETNLLIRLCRQHANGPIRASQFPSGRCDFCRFWWLRLVCAAIWILTNW